MNDAIKRYGKTSLLAKVQLKLNDALAALAPKIETIKLSDSAVTNLITKKTTTNNRSALKLNKTLYVGFNYINFEPKTTWLDATLIDLTTKTVIARKPIVISSQFGEHFFEINFPTGYLNNHNYKLELKLNKRALISKSF